MKNMSFQVFLPAAGRRFASQSRLALICALLSCGGPVFRTPFDAAGPIGFLAYYVTSPCNMDSLSIIQPWAWPFVQNELQYQAAFGSHETAAADVSSITGL